MNRTLILTVLAGVILASSVSVLYLSAKSVLPELPKLPFITPSPPAGQGRPLGEAPTSGQQQGSEVKFDTLGKAQTSEHGEKENYVVNSQEEWRQLWDKITGPTARAMPVPVNFDKETVVAVFQGQKGSAGYTIEVTKILQANGTLEVFITGTSPGKNCLTAAVITAPYHIIKVEKFTREVKFTQEQKVTDCR